MAHDWGNAGCPRNADPRNTCCDCDRPVDTGASKEVHISRALEMSDALAGKNVYTEQELALRSLAGAYRRARMLLERAGTLTPDAVTSAARIVTPDPSAPAPARRLLDRPDF